LSSWSYEHEVISCYFLKNQINHFICRHCGKRTLQYGRYLGSVVVNWGQTDTPWASRRCTRSVAQYSLSPLLGTLCCDRILPTWQPICLRGGRSQSGIGLDPAIEAGRSAFVTRHRAQERMPQQRRKTVFNMLLLWCYHSGNNSVLKCSFALVIPCVQGYICRCRGTGP